MLNKFSEELKESRLKNELSLQQIAAKTHIDLKFLENLENGNFVFLPELYIKAFIKEYANLVGLDEKITLKKFDAAKKGKVYDELGNTEDDIKKLKQEKEEVKPSKTRAETSSNTTSFEAYYSSNQQNESTSEPAKKNKFLIGIAIGILTVFIIIYFTFIRGNSDIIVSEKPYDEVQKDNDQRFNSDSQKPAVTESNPAEKSDSLSLVLEAIDTSWIKMSIDGTATEEFTLYPYSHKQIKAFKNYRMTIGNAGAVQIKLNNKLLNFIGTMHEVKYVSIDSSGLQYLTSSPNL